MSDLQGGYLTIEPVRDNPALLGTCPNSMEPLLMPLTAPPLPAFLLDSQPVPDTTSSGHTQLLEELVLHPDNDHLLHECANALALLDPAYVAHSLHTISLCPDLDCKLIQAIVTARNTPKL